MRWTMDSRFASDHLSNSVISSYNRNFTGRHDGNPQTHSFVTSPELATAFAYSGYLTHNPAVDSITTDTGKAFKFTAPRSEELPESFAFGEALYQAPTSLEDSATVQVPIDPNSDRLQLLQMYRPA